MPWPWAETPGASLSDRANTTNARALKRTSKLRSEPQINLREGGGFIAFLALLQFLEESPHLSKLDPQFSSIISHLHNSYEFEPQHLARACAPYHIGQFALSINEKTREQTQAASKRPIRRALKSVLGQKVASGLSFGSSASPSTTDMACAELLKHARHLVLAAVTRDWPVCGIARNGFIAFAAHEFGHVAVNLVDLGSIIII